MRLLLAVFALSIGPGALGNVALQLPFYAQLPQIAHVGSPYTWTFDEGTFGFTVPEGGSTPVSPPSLTYSAQDMPAWVQFDAATRTFSGSPNASDEGGSRITVTASLADASMAMGGNTSDTSSFTLLTLDEPAPTVNISIANQLPSASSLGSKNILPGSVLHLPLGWSFSIGLEGDTFVIADGRTVYMSASVNNNTELPSWMTWSADSFTLYGVAPTSPGPEGSAFDVVVTGSNRPGFGGTTDTLKILVSPQALSLDGPLRTVNATVGDSFTYRIPTSALELDGRQNNGSSNPVNVSADLTAYPWMEFDDSTATISGTPPFDVFKDANTTQIQTVPLSFSDNAGNRLAANLTVNVAPSAFTASTLPNVFVEPGKPINISLAQYIRTPSQPSSYIMVQFAETDASKAEGVQVSFDPASASSFLHFDPDSLLLTGTFPAKNQSRVKVDVDATNANNQTSSAFFYLAGKGDSTVAGSGNNTGNGSDRAGGLSSRAKVALAGALGGAGGLLALIALMICCRRHVAKEEHDHSGIMHDDDEQTLTDASTRRKFKRAIVIRKGGEAMTPSTMAPSPYMNNDEKLHGSPTTLRGVVVEDPSGARRDAMHEGDEPKQSRMMTSLFHGQRKGARASNAGLGLGLGGGMGDEQAGGVMGTQSQGRLRRSASEESSQSRRSSWESDLFYDVNDQRANQNRLGVPEGAEDQPRRRGGGRNAATLTALNVRQRNTHINQSPAFHTDGVFTPPGDAASSGSHGEGDDEDGESMDAFEDSRTGLTPGTGLEEAQIMQAKVMQVRRHSPMMQKNNNPFSQAMGSSVDAVEDGYNGAFDDAEDEEGMEQIVASTEQPTRRREVTARNRNSALSAMTDNSQLQTMRTHFANEAASAAVDPFSPNPSFMDGASLSGYEPQETMRAVVNRPRTPPAAAAAHRRQQSGGSAASRHMPCPTVPAMVNYPVRFHIYPIVPPPMAGAPGSPGKRSGNALRYSLVVDDARAHLSPYRLTWPDMLADWLSFDESTFEAFGIVPPTAGLVELGDIEIALVSSKKTARIPPSPKTGSPGKSGAKDRTRTSIDSSHTVTADEDLAVVARARLVFQSPPHAF